MANLLALLKSGVEEHKSRKYGAMPTPMPKKKARVVEEEVVIKKAPKVITASAAKPSSGTPIRALQAKAVREEDGYSAKNTPRVIETEDDDDFDDVPRLGKHLELSVPRYLTLNQLSASDHLSVFLENQSSFTSKKGESHRIIFEVINGPDDKQAVKLEASWLPQEITNTVSRDSLLKSPNFRQALAKKMFLIVNPDALEEILQSPDAELESNRLAVKDVLNTNPNVGRQVIEAITLPMSPRERLKRLQSIQGGLDRNDLDYMMEHADPDDQKLANFIRDKLQALPNDANRR